MDVFRACKIGYQFNSGRFIANLHIHCTVPVPGKRWTKTLIWILVFWFWSFSLSHVWHGYAVVHRWIRSLSNSYETIVYVAWLPSLPVCCLYATNPRLLHWPPYSAGSFFCIRSELDGPEISTLVPVLKSPWLFHGHHRRCLRFLRYQLPNGPDEYDNDCFCRKRG